ncbi:hypothetical protein Mkiyose1665_59540 [Mycobacterium kiyosense]|uniref:Uncharacterized protein n=1 Tax=Mycobacterium kiyosense TaxID=2871094 RepID=A0AA37VD89_9MYCO|nr:hypothetical protein MKCMC460_59640 [Mycobacterium sp. 20KCMC460]GLB86975.1 hypothetical protein SRL2020028_62310 [Mycobacterium kiyosense]GLB93190.1 hypothetical protein SRL2020130_60070 [Mycobacterium kiyosense]GLB99185.1 hypothetical protein SRL2020226_59610 [Mycobacterium kiyosense]GLC05028.1 hypothetical protein SRL2020400_56190 [Mycobacterium kiyosense]
MPARQTSVGAVNGPAGAYTPVEVPNWDLGKFCDATQFEASKVADCGVTEMQDDER